MSDPSADPDAHATPQALAHDLVDAGGGSVDAVVLYGSHLLGTNPDRHSALDFVVVVDSYRGFYAALSAAGEMHRPVRIMTWMAHVLPPNVIAFAPGGGAGALAKCLVVDRDHLVRALGDTPPDHFLLGRLVQRVRVLWARDPDRRAWLEGLLAAAHEGVLEWMAPYLDGPVDGAGLGRRLLDVCYRAELRPEATDRSERIFEAQAEHFHRTFTPVLERAALEGRVRPTDAGYRLTRPVDAAQRKRWRWHFARSKIRATARWLKHTVTFSNWLPYVVRKVERHTGRPIHLTTLERRWPLLFLWPRAIRVLLSRPGKENET